MCTQKEYRFTETFFFVFREFKDLIIDSHPFSQKNLCKVNPCEIYQKMEKRGEIETLKRIYFIYSVTLFRNLPG